MTIMLLLVACAAGLACAVQSSKPEGGSSDLRDVCQRTLDSESLDKFFHVDQRPERKPLVVLKNDALVEEFPLTKFGERVQYATRDELKNHPRPYFEFRRISISDDQGTVEFAYPPEGIAGTATLRREAGSWKVTNVKVVER